MAAGRRWCSGELVWVRPSWGLDRTELRKGRSTAMYKILLIEVIAHGKSAEDRAYREKVQSIFDRYGVAHKVWSVEGRRSGQRLVEYGPFESQADFEAAAAKLSADEEWQALRDERIEAGVVVPGTGERFILTD